MKALLKIQKSKSTFKPKTHTKRGKIKYLIITSASGFMYGAFYPEEEEKARLYLEELRKKDPLSEIDLHKVTNLNLFMSRVKKKKK